MVGRSNQIGFGLLSMFCFSVVVLGHEGDPSVVVQDGVNEIKGVNSNFNMCK